MAPRPTEEIDTSSVRTHGGVILYTTSQFHIRIPQVKIFQTHSQAVDRQWNCSPLVTQLIAPKAVLLPITPKRSRSCSLQLSGIAAQQLTTLLIYSLVELVHNNFKGPSCGNMLHNGSCPSPTVHSGNPHKSFTWIYYRHLKKKPPLVTLFQHNLQMRRLEFAVSLMPLNTVRCLNWWVW